MGQHQRGDEARDRLIAELARREDLRLPAPIWAELDEAIGAISSRFHAEALREEGLVQFEDGVVRSIRLTAYGRRVADRREACGLHGRRVAVA